MEVTWVLTGYDEFDHLCFELDIARSEAEPDFMDCYQLPIAVAEALVGEPLNPRFKYFIEQTA